MAIFLEILMAALSAILLIQQYCQQYWTRSYLNTLDRQNRRNFWTNDAVWISLKCPKPIPHSLFLWLNAPIAPSLTTWTCGRRNVRGGRRWLTKWINESLTTVFVEQPKAGPGSAKYTKRYGPLRRPTSSSCKRFWFLDMVFLPAILQCKQNSLQRN